MVPRPAIGCQPVARFPILVVMGVEIIIGGLGILLAIVALVLVLQLRARVSKALAGADGDLESTLHAQHDKVKEVDTKLDELTKIYKELNQRASLASQKISLVRFNPFGDTGGDQSFALAVLDDHNSGYVLTSIHGRGGTRVYVKPIDFGKSKYNLSSEEQQAIKQATKRTPTPQEEE